VYLSFAYRRRGSLSLVANSKANTSSAGTSSTADSVAAAEAQAAAQVRLTLATSSMDVYQVELSAFVAERV
jgi:hypothetical protein